MSAPTTSPLAARPAGMPTGAPHGSGSQQGSGRAKDATKSAQVQHERELFVRWQRNGDEQAREELVRCFTPLARSLVRRYSRSSEPYEDLLQVAMLGLLKAIDRYDMRRGFSFQSFAVPTVLGEMRRYFRDSGWSIHVPRGSQERALALRSAHEQLMDERGHAPTIEELAQYLRWEQEQVLDAMQVLSAYDTVSLDAPVPGAQTEDASFAESIGDDDPHFELVDLGLTVASALRELSARDRRMLHMRFVEELTQTQIAARIGVSQMQVSRLLRRSLEQLRELSEARGDEHAPMAPTTLLAPQSDSTTEALSVKAA